MDMDNLTGRERDVLFAILDGHTSHKEIAAQLVLSRHTIRTHLHNIFLKWGVQSIPQLILHAHRNGLTGGEYDDHQDEAS
ncbi:MAG: hypothetical protein DCC55_25725 [Chloroflexi bacterium]|nr:MAG: hypothetical protein DCC55_25725 [Chloroflexota bacterium]